MEVKQMNLIYFSPTGTTQKVLESIANGKSLKFFGIKIRTVVQRATYARFQNQSIWSHYSIKEGNCPWTIFK